MTEEKKRLINMYGRFENALNELNTKNFCQGTRCRECEMFDRECKLNYVKRQLFDFKCKIELRYNIGYEEKITRKRD